MPVSQLEKEDPPKPSGGSPPRNPLFASSRHEGAKEEVFALDEGQILVRWPETLSEESYADVKEWLKILERKIGRCVRAPVEGQKHL